MKVRLAQFVLLFVVCGCGPNPGPPANPTPPPGPPQKVEGRFVPTDRKAAPMRLTAADGTGLRLVSLSASAVVDGPLAFTELHLIFENPEDRVLEGTFEITMPDGAAISRLAMLGELGWQEAEVVERQAARQAYEDFLHRRQDPALMEKQAGNQFQARVFPIPAKGRKELKISYSQEMSASSQPYRLPLQGLPRMSQLDLKILVGRQSGSGLKNEVVKTSRQDYAPEGDFEVPQQSAIAGLVSQGLIVARVSPQPKGQSDPVESLLVLVDTSASRGPGFDAQMDRVVKVLAALGEKVPIRVACFDQEVVQVFDGPAGQLTSDVLTKRRPGGATDFEKALKWAAGQKGFDRLLLVSDALPTAGETALAARVKSLPLKRLDLILVGGIRDRESALALVGGNLDREGMVLDGDLTVDELAHRLTLAAASGLSVSVEGADWVWPERLDNLQAGDERLIYAKLRQTSQSVRITIDGQTSEVALSSAAQPLLDRAAALARVARLESQLRNASNSAEREKLRNQIVELSTSKRVLSEHTALLVLETEDDYARFNIDRKALTDILVVGQQGLELHQRTPVQFAQRPVEMMEKNKESDLGLDKATADGGETSTDTLYVLTPAADDTVVTARQARLAEAPAGAAGAQTEYRRAQDAPGPAAQTRARSNDGFRSGGNEQPSVEEEAAAEDIEKRPALTGRLAEVMKLIKVGKLDAALAQAMKWHEQSPGDVLALVALGECFEARGQKDEAARAYGSIIDLYPSRADLRRFAGCRLDRLAHPLAVDTYRKAVEQRPDHVSGHRMLAYALVRQGDLPAAFAAISAGLQRDYPDNRFLSWERILRDDAGLIAAAWLARDPSRRPEVEKKLKALGTQLATKPSLRFVLTWETDANDVDFHIHDSRGGHAYYSDPKLPSGGELYGDVTTGYGPECFNIPTQPAAFPYKLAIHYYSRGPMGYGMGKVEICQHDGKGNLRFEQRPYVVMQDQAFVELGTVPKPL
ncbi:MAG: VIT domain-containing protein [Vulcanimicrobiota bacterium]